jgi:DNA-binding transcriptional LysR family regulator
MHVETLKVFCDIIESGSFSYAASQNFVTQSAVSQQVRSLEEKYGCRLVERGRTGVKPTAAGRTLYNASKEIVRLFMELDTTLREAGSVVSGSIRVGTVYSVGLHEIPPYLTEFLRLYPAVAVHLEYLRSNRIYDDLMNGRIDLGVLAYPVKRSQITMIPFRSDEMVLIVPPNHRKLAGRQSVRFSELEGESFIGYERDIPTRKATDRVLRTHDVKPRYVMEFDNIETIKRAVEIGLGVAIVPRPSVEREATLGWVKVLGFEGETFLRPLAIIYKRSRELWPALRKFIDVLTAGVPSPGPSATVPGADNVPSTSPPTPARRVAADPLAH